MKNNVFCLIVDALSYPYLNDKFNAMPFLKQLQERGHNCANMYSQGPYTEAALTPFYTGRDNMDYGGNFFRGQQASQTVFEAFEANGYDVLNYTQPLIYPKPMHRGINEERYGVCYFFSAVWDYRLAYFADLYKNNALTDKDYKNIEELLGANFEFWIEYYLECKNSYKASDFINSFAATTFDFDLRIQQVTSQYKEFLANKSNYIKNLFELGGKHQIFAIDNYLMTKKSANSAIYCEIKKEYKRLFKKIERFNKEHNRSCDFSIQALLRACIQFLRGSKVDAFNMLKKFHYHSKLRSTKKEISNIFRLKANYKPEPTILRYFDHFCKWNNERSKYKPYYCTMHISDLHTPEVFFSIDSEDIIEVKKELNVLNEFIDSLPIDFSGNIMYWLSMRYVDYCIEKMFKWFHKNGQMSSTLFIITADHGSSFGFRPVRTSLVNNEHDENYHIPCVFLGNKVKSSEDKRYYTTKDIAKTILEYSGIHNSEFTGKDILNCSEDSQYAISEYLGAGCPDIARKPINFVIRDNNYCVGLKQIISKNFSVDNIYCVYDRNNDPEEKVNLISSVNFIKIKYLIDKLELRFNQIQGEYYESPT